MKSTEENEKDCNCQYLEATLIMARKHPEVGEQFEQLLQSLKV